MKSPCFLQLIPCSDVFIGCKFPPSEAVFEQCTKEQLLRITDHLSTETWAFVLKQRVKRCSVDVGILTNEK